MTLKLYTYPQNKNAYKALIAAQYVGVDIEVPPFRMGEDNKTPAFLKLNPLGKVPTLETPEGGVFESNAIARYVARLGDKGLLGHSAFEEAQVEQWIDFFTTEIDGPLLSWFLPLINIYPYNKQKEEAAIQALKKALATLDKALGERTYLHGHAPTLADIVGVCCVHYGYTKLFDEAWRASTPHVTRWYTTLVNQPAFSAVLGSPEFAKETLKYTPPAKAPKAPKEKAPAGEAKPAPAAKPKPAAAPAPAAAEEEDEPAAKPEPKPKNPLDDLPKSTMILDSWKRLYSNTPAADFREVALKGLWNGGPIPKSPNNEVFAGFDPEGFSVWFCDYKYPEENTVSFIVMNKVGGFLQRIDYARKYAFGVMAILKSEGQFPIKGVWIFRGQGIPPIMVDECYDLELYNWTKADTNDPAQRARIEAIINEDDKIDGIELAETKVFK